MPLKKKTATRSNKSQNHDPKVTEAIKNLVKPKRKKKEHKLAVDLSSIIKKEILGRDERQDNQEPDISDVVEILGGEQPSVPISNKVAKSFTGKQLTDRLATFFTLNKQVETAEEISKTAPDPMTRKLKRPSNDRSESALLGQITADLHRLINFYLQNGQYDKVAEYSAMLVTFSSKARDAKSTVCKKLHSPTVTSNMPLCDSLNTIILSETVESFKK